ncbi:FAD-dependent oxidoreductase [Micromonospora sp. SL1-18]|uniref:FAD-dependent oxidoreductase n=1 Tax=Micromonospora sp. SL1-18 TaxID=3399128 RepID=UPI003A4D5725
MVDTAAIIGGGIGGLATAIALRRSGWRVTVYERDAEIPATGTALGMWPAALRALDTLGVGDDVRKLGRRQSVGEFRRPDGTRIATIDTARLERRSGDPVYLLSRPALLTVLHRAMGETALRFGTPQVRQLTRLREEFDLVVAADGVFSQARTELLGERYRARYSGGTAWRGYVENMPTDSFVETWGAGAKFGVTPQEGGRTNWYAAAAAPEGSFTPGSELATLRRRFGSWAAPVRAVLDAISESEVLRHDVYVTPWLPTFTRDNVALIGDAAHAMTPDLGRGGCEALIDAVTLAACLRDAPAVRDGLRAYDRQRRRPTQRLARISNVAARMNRMRRALWIRDGLLRASMLTGPPD